MILLIEKVDHRCGLHPDFHQFFFIVVPGITRQPQRSEPFEERERRTPVISRKIRKTSHRGVEL